MKEGGVQVALTKLIYTFGKIKMIFFLNAVD